MRGLALLALASARVQSEVWEGSAAPSSLSLARKASGELKRGFDARCGAGAYQAAKKALARSIWDLGMGSGDEYTGRGRRLNAYLEERMRGFARRQKLAGARPFEPWRPSSEALSAWVARHVHPADLPGFLRYLEDPAFAPGAAADAARVADAFLAEVAEPRGARALAGVLTESEVSAQIAEQERTKRHHQHPKAAGSGAGGSQREADPQLDLLERAGLCALRLLRDGVDAVGAPRKVAPPTPKGKAAATQGEDYFEVKAASALLDWMGIGPGCS